MFVLLERDVLATCLRFFGEYGGGLSSGRTVLLYRPKQESTKHGSAAKLTRPGSGSSAGCYSPWLPGEGEAPRPGRPGEAAPSATRRPRWPTASRLRPPPRKRTDGPARAHGVQPARLAARSRRVSRRALGASCGAQAARRAARTRRIFRRATCASCDAHPARLPTRAQRV